MSQTESILIEEVTSRFQQVSEQSIEILDGHEGLEKHIDVIKGIIAQLADEGILKVSLIGQYSAGKSTIISAMTGDKAVKIDADIATDEVKGYDWNGITVMDTPGLHTDRLDHDLKTLEAIESSDLLVYVLTSDLFDDFILANFRKLAFTQSYRHKMMLVVNKMSMESGEYEELKANYTTALKETLQLADLDEFRISFIDAAEYIEGIEDDDEEFIELSHFGEFIGNFNDFVQEKQLLGKIDRPIRNVITELGEAISKNQGEEADTFYKLLNRIESRVKKSSIRSENELKKITSEIRSEIIRLGSRLTSMIGGEGTDFDNENKKVEVSIQELIEEKNKDLQQSLNKEREELTSEIQTVLSSELAEVFFDMSTKVETDVTGRNVKLLNTENIQKNLNALNSIAGRASDGILKISNTAGQSGFVNATKVSGTSLHKGIYSIGKFFGVKFKPYQAVNAAKTMTNVAKVAGPVLALAGVLFEVANHVKEEAELKKILNAKDECSSMFVALGKKVEDEFTKQFNQYNDEMYNSLLTLIAEERQKATERYASSSDLQVRVNLQIGELNKLLSMLK